MIVRYKRLSPTSKIEPPKYSGDAGIDLFSDEDVSIPPGESEWVGTGIALELPEGYVGLIKEKSGLAKLFAIGAGVIDSSYRGEIKVLIRNLGKVGVEIKKGQPIAQLLVLPCPEVKIEEGELSETERGERGFGSTYLADGTSPPTKGRDS